MQWHDITVQQFQQITEIWQGADKSDPAFFMMDIYGICHNLTPKQVDSIPTVEMNARIKELDFLKDIPEWEPVRHFTANGRRYRFVYDVRQIHAARNIEVKQFSAGGFIPEMHKMAASMVMPQRRNWYGKWVDDAYDAAKHEQYAADILQAPITGIYGSSLFFCEVFTKSMAAIQDYLISQMPETTREEATRLLAGSCRILDGISTQHKSPSWSGLP